MTVKELIDKLQQFDEDKLVLVEDTEYKEFQAIDVEPVDDRFVIITTVGKKTTIGVLTCLTGFEATVSSSCVKPENYDINIGKKYAIEKAKDQIWSGLGFVLQWAINGLKRK